ncbi:MAG: hypothetical protein JXD23_08930 [Spirochaetales bacterium]|nr:hypothetical protein [Spirochaetales bacterium]
MQLRDLKKDVQFIKGHTLQPAWFKVVKIVFLIGIVVASLFIFGVVRTAVWVLVFLSLALIVHFVYRAKTKVFTKSWLDFKVVEKNGKPEYKRIGAFYYSFVIASFAAAIVIALLV